MATKYTAAAYNDTVKYSAIAWAGNGEMIRNLTMTANVVPTDAQHPFTVLNQARSRIKLRINNNTKAAGSRILDYNIEIPELYLLFRQAESCSISPRGVINNAPGSGEKVVGEPDANGFALVKKLTIKHNDNTDGTNKYPWYIAIEHGKALVVQGGNGTRYSQPGSYMCEDKVYINISETDMFSVCFWTYNCVERFIEGTKNFMLKAWNEMQTPQAPVPTAVA